MLNNYLIPKYFLDSHDFYKNIQIGITTESNFLDFKLSCEISLLSPKKKLDFAEELALDICQFVNSWGGVLLIGIKESYSNLLGKRIVDGFPGVTNIEEINQFINDNVLQLIYPKNIKIDLRGILINKNTQIVVINIFPLANGVACVLNDTAPYISKFPYRTHYGKKYLHPMEVEKRMSENHRNVPIKLEDISRRSREVSLFPKLRMEAFDQTKKWDFETVSIILKSVTDYEFTLKISGLDINIPFSLVKDVWQTERNTIGILLSAQLIFSSDRKSILMDI